jgi:hypothetical protein
MNMLCNMKPKKIKKMVCVCTLFSASKLINGLNRVWLHAACIYIYRKVLLLDELMKVGFHSDNGGGESHKYTEGQKIFCGQNCDMSAINCSINARE